MAANQLLINIYEEDSKTPVIGHVFYGTKTQVDGIIAAHKRTDRFFRAAMEGEPFEGMQLRITQEWLA